LIGFNRRRRNRGEGEDGGTCTAIISLGYNVANTPSSILPDSVVFMCIKMAMTLVVNRHFCPYSYHLCKYARKCIISYVKYPKIPGGNTTDLRVGGCNPLSHLPPAQGGGASTRRLGHRSSAPPPILNKNREPMDSINSTIRTQKRIQ